MNLKYSFIAVMMLAFLTSLNISGAKEPSETDNKALIPDISMDNPYLTKDNPRELPKLDKAKQLQSLHPIEEPTAGLGTTPEALPILNNNETDGLYKQEPVFSSKQSQKPTPIRGSNPTVYVSKTGRCYHASGCRFIGKNARIMPLDQAEKEGYRSCQHCR